MLLDNILGRAENLNINALLTVLNGGDIELEAGTQWRCLPMRTSSTLLDFVFSIPGFFSSMEREKCMHSTLFED